MEVGVANRMMCAYVCCESGRRNVVICIFFPCSVTHFSLMKAGGPAVLGVAVKEDAR